MIGFSQYLIEEDYVSNLDLQAEYKKYNDLIFDGSLPTINLVYKNMKAHGCCLSFQNKRTGERRLDSIYISNKYHMTYDQFKDILVHEMIHAFLAFNHVHDVGGQHGYRFQNMLRKVNGMGLGVHVTLNVEHEAPVAIDNKKAFTVFIVLKNTGQYVLVPCKVENSEAFKEKVLRRYINEFKIMYEIISKDNNLLRYTIARSPSTIKFFLVDESYVETLLSTAINTKEIKGK